MDKLTEEVKQPGKGVNNDTKHKLNSNKGVITNMDLSWIYQRMRRKLQSDRIEKNSQKRQKQSSGGVL